MESCSPTPQATLQQQQNSADYLAQLLKDKKQIAAFPNVFVHLERLLDDEINKVRISLFHLNGNKKLEPLQLPDARGPIVTLMEKVFVPVKEFPDFNFVGRILGPRGMTAKQLEQDTGCKIMVRGKGSMRDKKKEEQNRGKANWEHLNEELHVLITVEDTEERAKIKLERAVECITKLLIPAADGEDDLKKSQLMELAIMNGTYRDGAKALQQQQAQRLLGQPGTLALTSPVIRSPTAAGAPLILPPRMPTIPGSTPSAAAAAAYLSQGMAAPPPLISPADPATGLMYHPVEYPVLTAAAPTLLEYQTLDPNAAAVVVSSASSPFAIQRYVASAGNLMQYHDPSAIVKQRRHIAGMRDHPYQRGPVSLS